MSKTLRTAALVVGAVALVATGAGAIVGAAAVTSAIGVSAATLSAVAAGASAVVALTAKKPSATATGSPTEFRADPQGFLPYVIGRTGTSGNIIFRRGFDTRDAGENDRQSFVAILSACGPVQAIERQEVDRALVQYSATGAALGAYAGFMWHRAQLGAAPEPSALSFGAGAGNPPGWDAQSKLSGYAAAAWTLRFDTKAKLFQSGEPTPRWIVQGVLCYDPRRDSTYPGGSGAQRANSEATWGYSENPFVHALTWIIGRHQNGKRIMGLGSPIEAIDVAAYVEGANVADANGWKVGGVVYSGDGKWVTLKKILQAGMGEPLALGARISCMVNAPKVSLATITTDDLVGEASVTATQPRRDRINTITPRYRLEANNWELLPGSPITVAAHVAEDKGQRSREQDYPLIQNTPQVATAVRYDIENAREFGPIILPLKTVWIGYKPGDCVTAILPELGLNGQTILLLNRDFDPSTGVPTITARSETAAKHAFALGQTTTPPPTPGVAGPLLVPVPADGAWAITGTEVRVGETTSPAIVIAGATDSPVAETVVFEYRVMIAGQGGDAGWQGAGEEPPTVTGKAITGIRPGAQYQAAVSYRRRGIVGERRVLGPVQVGDLALDFDYVTGGTKPDPNATNGADPASPMGPNRTVSQVLADIAAAKDDIAVLFDQIGADPGSGGTIGDAVAAAKEAQRLAELAQGLADEAADAAALQAGEAARQAGLGKGYSDTAKSYQDEAGRKVEAAQAQVRLAETEVGKARDFVTAAQLLRDDVDGLKAQAVQASGLSVQAKNDAARSAEASAESSRLAGIEKTATGQLAGAAAADRLLTETAKGQAEAARDIAVTSRDTVVSSEQKTASLERLAATASENATYLDTYRTWTFGTQGIDGWYVVGANYDIRLAAGVFYANNVDEGHIQIDNLSFAGARYDRVIVDVTRNSPRSNGYFEGRIYYATPGHYWDAAFFAECDVREVGVGERVQLTFDMRNQTAGGRDWINNIISSIRLDLDQGQNSEWLIHSIRIVGSDSLSPVKSASAAAESARVAGSRADEAGVSAYSASQSVLAAGGQAGAAKTYRDEAAGYRSDASGFAQAAATTASELKARIYSRNNLLPYGSGENGINQGENTWRGSGGTWYTDVSPSWGPRMQCDNPSTATISLDSPIIPCDPGQWYTASADLLFFTDAPAPSCYVDIIFLRPDGSVAKDGTQRSVGPRDFGTPDTRDLTWVSDQAPADANRMYMRAVWQGSSGTHRNIGLREGKIEQGQGPYTAYSQEATLFQQAGVIADSVGKQRAYFEVNGAVPGAQAAIRLLVANDNGNLTSDIVLDATNLYLNGRIWLNNQLLTGGIVPNAIEWTRLNTADLQRVGANAWAGYIKPNFGQTIEIPIAFTLNNVHPSGRFASDVIGAVTWDHPSQVVSTHNGRTYYINYLRNGGLVINATTGNGQPAINLNDRRTGGAFGTAMTTTDNVTVRAYVVCGSTDTGIVDEGDYYSRQISDTCSISNLRIVQEWLAN